VSVVVRALLVVVLLLAGCHREPADTYPPDVVQNFLRSCTRRADERTCRCALGQLERRVSLDEFHALEARIGRGELPQEMAEAAATCQ
jgi:hypothetical protein